ncbi:amidohydrolase family protein [Actinomadura sp. LD22]|uniref:Amidohydrolase family protein n=2 Tax=Actinomadura physcomitrii TaxID=2650748 RepID=A0A6I4MJT0_9ACTN|nr:amidohydrolase family protein [Actinomadura physcomitrii]
MLVLARKNHAAQVPPVRKDPAPRDRRFTIISVDDHLMEPPDTFDGRLPARFADRTPHVVEGEHGREFWNFDGELVPVSGADALVSWELISESFNGPVRFDEVRRGMWDVHARVADMDLAGVAASLSFPSMIYGFAGQRFMRMADRELGFASMQAYNDWIAEGWVGPYPDRMIPCQVTWLPDPEKAAAEIRRNAERGFKAVAFSENPAKLGLPSIYSEEWDPFLKACEETETVINLHIGSSSSTMKPTPDSPIEVVGKLFTVNAMAAVLDWIYAKVPVRYPNIKIAMSEAGIGWLPWMIDRIDYQHQRTTPDRGTWGGYELTPSEVLQRNFWFTSFYDPKGFAMLDLVDQTKILVETDYPHADSTWPDCQAALDHQLAALTPEQVELVTHKNATALYRHPVPAGWTLNTPGSTV